MFGVKQMNISEGNIKCHTLVEYQSMALNERRTRKKLIPVRMM